MPPSVAEEATNKHLKITCSDDRVSNNTTSTNLKDEKHRVIPALISPFFDPQLSTDEHLPKLIIVDLDYTLWKCFVWEDTSPPYRRIGDSDVCTCNPGIFSVEQSRALEQNLTLSLYNHVRCILNMARQWGIKLAIASKSKGPAHAQKALAALGLWGTDIWASVQIIPHEAKSVHVTKILKETGFSSHDALFFDDTEQNVLTVRQKSGIVGILVDRCTGLDGTALHRGFISFRQSRIAQLHFKTFLTSSSPPTPPFSEHSKAPESDVTTVLGCPSDGAHTANPNRTPTLCKAPSKARRKSVADISSFFAKLS